MSLRKEYDAALGTLVEMVARMGGMVTSANAKAMEALKKSDVELAKSVVDGDREINAMERKIEQSCMELLLRQQPVASDLRRVSAVLKLVTDSERMGDEAKNIAELVPWLSRSKHEMPIGLAEMGEQAVRMTMDCIDAFVRQDLEQARRVVEADDKVDEAFGIIKREIADWIAREPDEIDAALDYLMVIRYLERLGDHAVNVAEWAKFCMTGMHKDQRIV